jgi:hypothetical protein
MSTDRVLNPQGQLIANQLIKITYIKSFLPYITHGWKLLMFLSTLPGCVNQSKNFFWMACEGTAFRAVNIVMT